MRVRVAGPVPCVGFTESQGTNHRFPETDTVNPKLPETFTLADWGAGVPICHCHETDDGESGSVNVSGGNEPLEGVGGKTSEGPAETS